MSTTSPPPGSAIELLWAAPADLQPNLYNPNVLDADLYDKAVASIERYGFVDPVTARRVGGGLEIIDGEHRVKAAAQLKIKLIPVIIVEVDDDVAQQLTLVLNELHGRPDQARLRRVLDGLAQRTPIEKLLETLPFARDQFLQLAPSSPGSPALTPPPDTPRWVERMYRLPWAAASVLDEALARAKEYEEVHDDWQALQAVANVYLEKP